MKQCYILTYEQAENLKMIQNRIVNQVNLALMEKVNIQDSLLVVKDYALEMEDILADE